MGTVLGTLGKLGYWWTYRVLDSRYFALAQRRSRVFVVGRLGAFCPPEILLEPACLPGDPAPGREAWEDAAGELEGGAGDEGGGVANAVPRKYRGDPHERTDTLVCASLDTNAGDYSRSDSGAIVAGTLESRTLGGGFPGTDGACAGHVVIDEQNAATVPMVGTLNTGHRNRGFAVAHTLRAEGHDASEDGTGRGVPLVADTLVTGGREMPPHGTGDGKNIVVADTLRVGGRDQGAGSSSDNTPIVLGFRPTDGLDMQVLEDQSPTVKVGSGVGIASPPGVLAFSPLQGGRSMPVTPESPTLEAGTGNKAPGVLAFDTTQVTSPGNYSKPKPGDPCHPLAAGAHPPAIAYALGSHAGAADADATNRNHAAGGPTGMGIQEECSHSLRQGRTQSVVAAIPRRLTPTECERLQGFPDGWTAWGVDESGNRVELADSPRYAQLGNAVSVTPALWISKRIMEFGITRPLPRPGPGQGNET